MESITSQLIRFFTDLKHVLTPRTLVRVVRHLLANDAMPLGGQLAYFFVLFLFPFLIFLISLAGLVVDNPETIFRALVASTEGFLPQAAIGILTNHLDRTLQSTTSSTFLIAGLLTLVVGSASTGSIISTANRAYGVPETRPFWKRWLLAALLIVGFTLLIATMAFMVLSPQTGDYLERTLGLPLRLMREGIETLSASEARMDRSPQAFAMHLAASPLEPVPAALLRALACTQLGAMPMFGSTWQSMVRGSSTEVDYLNGEIVTLGAKLGRSTLYNQRVVQLIGEVERSREFYPLEKLWPEFYDGKFL